MKFQYHCLVTSSPSADHVSMAEKVVPRLKPEPRRYFFREWRKYRGLTQEQLAERVGMAASSISQLEKGRQGFTDSSLALIAEALMCEPGDLLMRNPLDTEAPWSIWENIPKAERPQAIAILKTFEHKKAS